MGDILETSTLQQYIASFYFSMTTLTTVGYGDNTPHNTVEQVTAVCFMACGVVFFAFLVSHSMRGDTSLLYYWHGLLMVLSNAAGEDKVITAGKQCPSRLLACHVRAVLIVPGHIPNMSCQCKRLTYLRSRHGERGSD